MLKLHPRVWLSRRSPVRVANRRRRSRTAVLAGIVCVLFANVALGVAAERYPRIRDPFYGDKLVKLQAKLRKQREPSIVMLGSSRTGFAFHGLRIEERFRERGQHVVAFNFGIPASGPVTHNLYLKRLLRDGVKPSLLLVEVLPSMFVNSPSGPHERLFLFGDRLVHREIETTARYGLNAQDLRERWRGSTLFPWYGLRFQLLARVVPSWIPWQYRCDWSRGTDASGWGTPLRETVTDDERAAGLRQANAEYAALLHDWKPDGGAVAAFEDILRTCQSNGIPVRLIVLPESPSFQQMYTPQVRDRIDEYFARTCTMHGCGLINARNWLDEQMFTDGHHQLRRGAEAFSDRLAEQLLGGVP